MHSLERHRLAQTPLSDRLIALQEKSIESFHALPLSRGKSIKSSRIAEKYRRIYGDCILQYDLTYTGNVFDTPVMPRLCVDRSRMITAEAFGADFTSYVTMGTTTSNYIAIFALSKTGDRVLADRACHQS